ncbi:hypothetical protein [Streptomyces sp. S.PB5]|uniref:hypothetical protein n=1 Tax=Streptomyces sp. S.PB5 TaxID=3020844 RepID=UPI0025AF5DA2|nr:hypothetical protein [Streptomyces sp. S.PB5]MDN3026439.1 hypothetical protein [Streptomyces sp. S.PB5]
MSKIRTLMAACAATAALAGGLALSTGSAGAQTAGALAACGTEKHVETSGAEADWTISCSRGKVNVFGNVTDTAADGECARVYALYNDGSKKYSEKACPKGETQEFDFPAKAYSDPDSAVKVYLQEL